MLTDAHLEAMARETVRDWLARPILDPVGIGIAKQIARMELFANDYRAWRGAMGLPDTDETFHINRRISAIWIESIGAEGAEERMVYARKIVELENNPPKEKHDG